jgi:hypothetical protein
MTENSTAVRVIEKNSLLVAQVGTETTESSLQKGKVYGRTVSYSWCVIGTAMIPSLMCGGAASTPL